MASYKEYNNSKGGKYYRIQVSRGRGLSPACMTWHVPNEMLGNQKKINKERDKQIIAFEEQVKNGEYRSRSVVKAEKLQAEIEKAKVQTVKEFAEDVFIPFKKNEDCVEVKTIQAYQDVFNNHVYGAIGNFKLKDVTSGDLQKLIYSLTNTNDHTKPLSKKSIELVHTLLKQFFKKAYKDQLIDKNPMDCVDLPRKSKGAIKNKYPESYTNDQIKLVLKYADEEIEATKDEEYQRTGTNKNYRAAYWHKALIILLLETGIREGECCGLRWNNVNFKDKEITISNNVVYSRNYGTVQTSPKGKAQRVIPMSDLAYTTLLQLKAFREEDVKRRNRMIDKRNRQHVLLREPCEVYIAESQYCFPQYNFNKPMSPQTITSFFSDFAERHNLDFHFHAHGCRHTFITQLVLSGADLADVQEISGHANISTTMHYVHPTQESKRNALLKREQLNQGSVVQFKACE